MSCEMIVINSSGMFTKFNMCQKRIRKEKTEHDRFFTERETRMTVHIFIFSELCYVISGTFC